MNSRYKQVVFDEWAVVSFAEHKTRILAYNGPRREEFQKEFGSDAGALRAGLMSPEHEPEILNSPVTASAPKFRSLYGAGSWDIPDLEQHRPIYGRHCQRSALAGRTGSHSQT